MLIHVGSRKFNLEKRMHKLEVLRPFLSDSHFLPHQFEFCGILFSAYHLVFLEKGGGRGRAGGGCGGGRAEGAAAAGPTSL